MSGNITYPVKGSCQCGNVRFELSKPPILVAACHCLECQKLSTSAFSVTSIVDAAAITFKGELKDWQRSSDSGNTNAAKFCPHCGNRIYHYDPDNPEKIKLKLKSDAETPKPTLHIWLSKKQPWVEIPADVEQHDTQPW